MTTNLQSDVRESQLVVVIDIQEGRGSGEEDEGENPQGPDVRLGGDVFVLDDLWSNKLCSPHHRPNALLGGECEGDLLIDTISLLRSSVPEKTRSR